MSGDQEEGERSLGQKQDVDTQGVDYIGGVAASWVCQHPQCSLPEAEEASSWGTAQVSGLSSRKVSGSPGVSGSRQVSVMLPTKRVMLAAGEGDFRGRERERLGLTMELRLIWTSPYSPD